MANQIICANCEAPNQANAEECSVCGHAFLPQGYNNIATVPITDEVLQALSEAETAEFDESEQAPESKKTKQLDQIGVQSDDTLKFGSVAFNGVLILTEEVTHTSFRIEDEAVQEVIIGRSDPAINHQPKVDLAPFNAAKRGVSRHHAVISWRDDVLVITDCGSMNGTYLNGKRLVPDKARVLRDGDILHISSVRLDVAFQKASAPANR